MPELRVVSRNVLNVHAEASADSETITQALMGQPAWVLEESDEWLRIRTWDGYIGWARGEWLLERPEGVPYPTGSKIGVLRELFTDIHERPDTNAQILAKAVISTTLEVLGQEGAWSIVSLPTGQSGYLNGTSLYLTVPDRRLPAYSDQMIRTAQRFVGIPYLWGGTSPFGLDCSGFVQLVYHIHGITLPRDANMQAADERARHIEQDELQPIDLIFFAGLDDRQRITHVGMWLGDGRFIHSSSSAGVTVSRLEEERYSSIYHSAHRLDEVLSPVGGKVEVES